MKGFLSSSLRSLLVSLPLLSLGGEYTLDLRDISLQLGEINSHIANGSGVGNYVDNIEDLISAQNIGLSSMARTIGNIQGNTRDMAVDLDNLRQFLYNRSAWTDIHDMAGDLAELVAFVKTNGVAGGGAANLEIWEPFYAWTNFFLSFFPYRDEEWYNFTPDFLGETGYFGAPWIEPLTKNFPEYLSLTLGGTLDQRALDGSVDDWEKYFALSEGAEFNWYWWMAEAQRRQLAAASNTAWNVQQLGAAIMSSNVLQSSGWTGTDTSNASDWSDAVNDYESMQALPDPEDDPGQASPPDIEEAVPELEWELEGASPQEIALFQFSALNREYTGTLAVDFTGRHWTVIRLVCSFCWSVLFATGMFMIVRNEWNFWTTLGGSAT